MLFLLFDMVNCVQLHALRSLFKSISSIYILIFLCTGHRNLASFSIQGLPIYGYLARVVPAALVDPPYLTPLNHLHSNQQHQVHPMQKQPLPMDLVQCAVLSVRIQLLWVVLQFQLKHFVIIHFIQYPFFFFFPFASLTPSTSSVC